MTDDVDPITLAVVQGALQAAQRAMTVTMEKTGRSNVYAIARDYSNALFDWETRMVLQGEDLPTHLGSLVLAAKAVARYFEGEINPGDVFYHNDPTYDGGHIPDMTMYKPVFFEGELVFWTVSKGHVADAGGPVPGTYNSGAREIYAEGLRIPPIKIVDGGVLRHDIVNLLLTNVRSRRNQRGDLNAQFGAVTVGEKRLIALLEQFGIETVTRCIERLLDRAEAHMREKIARLPDGVYRSSVLAEDNGHGNGDQTLRSTVTIEGETMDIRLEAPPQLDYFTNSYRSNTLSGVYAALMMCTQIQPPFNEGLYRPVNVDFGPPGTMVNAVEPAPHVACTGGPQETICDLVRAALVQADSTNAPAGWSHTWGFTIAGARPDTGEPYLDLMLSSIMGGAGALSGVADGWDTLSAQAGLGGAQIGDTELVELTNPIIVHKLEIATDSAQPGRWRGGFSLITEIEPVGHDMTISTWGEGGIHPPPSVDVDRAPALPDEKLSRGWHTRDGELVREVRQNQIFVVRPGERYRSRAAGGGGAGDPFQRPPELVHADVRSRRLSVEAAAAEYGVALDATTLEVDADRTRALRGGDR